MVDMETDPDMSEGGVDRLPGSTVRISGVCGSLSATSTTKMALSIAIEGASEYGAVTELLELRDYEMAFFGALDEDQYPPDIAQLRTELRNSQGIILATPEYHGSLSGALKNMLDFMGPDEFEGKIVGLVGVAGGHTGAINSLNAMRTIGRNLHSWVLPQEVSIADSARCFNEDGSVTDSAVEKRLRDLGAQIVRLASLQQRIQQDDFMKNWQGLERW